MSSAQQRQLKLLFSIIKEQIPTQLIERKHTSPLHLKNKIKLFITITQQKNCLISPQGKKNYNCLHIKKIQFCFFILSLVILMSVPVYSIYIHSPLPFPSPLKGGQKKITCKIATEKCLAHRQAKGQASYQIYMQ